MMFKINNYEMQDDYVMTDLSVSSPVPKTQYISVPGRSDVIDVTESIHGLAYEQRKIKAVFVDKPYDVDAYHDLLKQFQGKQVKLHLHENYHYLGRIAFDSYNRYGTAGKLGVEMTCDPYRYKNDLTYVNVSSTTTEKTIVLNNEQMPTTVKMATTAQINIKHGVNNYSYNAGTHTLPFALLEGANELKVKGTAELIFEYQEGAL